MARWNDLAVWRGPTPNQGPPGSMNRYDGQVTHIAAGWFEGTIAWQLNPDANVSSHFVVGREWGQCAQMVDTGDAAHTQGDGNGEWISVENEGFPRSHRLWRQGWELLSDWQIECNARLFARGHREYGWPLQLTSHPTRKGLGYHGMGAENGYNWGHLYCPGEPIKGQQPLILARAGEILTGTGNTKGHNDMLLIKTNDDATVYISQAGEYRPMTSEAAFNAARQAGLPIVTVANMAELEDLAGRPKGEPVPAPPVDATALAQALAPLLPQPPTAEAVAEAVLAKKGELAKAVTDEIGS